MGGHFVYFHTFSGWVCAIRVRIKAKRLVFRVRKDKTFLDLKIWNTCHVAIIRRILKFKFKFTNLKDYLCYFKFVEILKCLPFINYKAHFEFQFHKFEGLPILFQTCQYRCTLSTSKLLIVLDCLWTCAACTGFTHRTGYYRGMPGKPPGGWGFFFT